MFEKVDILKRRDTRKHKFKGLDIVINIITQHLIHPIKTIGLKSKTHPLINFIADFQSHNDSVTTKDNELSFNSNSTANGLNNNSNSNKSTGNNRLKRRKKTFIGDLSCMKNGFKAAPKIMNADIKYIR